MHKTTSLAIGFVFYIVIFSFFMCILSKEIHLLQVVSRQVALSPINFKQLFLLLLSSVASLPERIRHGILIGNLEAAII